MAWVRSRDLAIAAIKGTRKIERLEHNWASQAVTLDAEHLECLESIVNQGVPALANELDRGNRAISTV